MALPVDEERRRAIDSAAGAAHEIRTHVRPILSRHQCPAQSCGVETEPLSQLLEERRTETALIFEEHIVHFPVFSLGTCKLSGFRCCFRLRVDFVQGKIPEDETELLSKVLLQSFDDRIRAPTMRALVVSVLDKRDGCVLVTLDVILGANR